MSGPDWMPAYRINLWEGGFKNRLLDTVAATATREVEATAEAQKILDAAWKPGLRKGRRARPLVAAVMRMANGQSEEVARLTWTLNGVVRS